MLADLSGQLLAATEFWSALIGAVVGALGSGVISWALARQSASERKGEERDRKLLQQRALAIKCTLKLKILADDAYSNLLNIRRQLGPGWRSLRGTDLAARLFPILGAEQLNVRIELDEMAFLLDAKQSALLNEFVVFSQRQVMQGATMEMYTKKRSELSRYAKRGDGRTVSFVAEGEDAIQLHLLMIDLGDLADHIVTGADEQYRNSIELITRLGTAMKDFFRDPGFPAGEIDPDQMDKLLQGE